MIDLREYADLIREEVRKANDRDKNWKWSIKSIGKKIVRIRWGYLDYMEEKDSAFILEMDNEDADGNGGDWLWAKTPDRDHIQCWMVVEGVPNRNIGAECNIKNAIRWAIEEIEYYAHSRY